MTRHQFVQWVLLPNGTANDGTVKATAFVAPRLRPGEQATLADFPDFLGWPGMLSDLQLAVERDDGASTVPHIITTPALGTWEALFPAETLVRAFHFDDLADRPLVSYPVAEVVDYLRSRWADLAHRSLDDLPITSHHHIPIGPQGEPLERSPVLADLFDDLMAISQTGIYEGARDGAELSARLRAALDTAAQYARDLRADRNLERQPLIRPFGAGGTPREAFYALAGFHGRPGHEAPKSLPADRDQTRALLAEKLDFHHHLSLLGDHPVMLRELGLALDLQLPEDFVPATADADPPTRLRLRVTRQSAFPARSADPGAEVWNVDVTPWTQCRRHEIGGRWFFEATERSGRADYAGGFVHLDPARYRAETVDVDGLALKALNMAATLRTQDEQEQRPVEEPARDGVPAARTGGIALVHTGRAEQLHEDFYAARAHDTQLDDPDNPADLTAQELVRGSRMDVWWQGTWRSLHARAVGYRPHRNEAQDLDAEDEGAVQLALTSEAEDADPAAPPVDPDRPLYAHETVVTWDGWSLSLPRPGQSVPQEPAPDASTADLGSMQLAIAATALPGTLPRLRIGEEYRVRLRAVDLAGNSHDLEQAKDLAQALDDSGDPRYQYAAPDKTLRYRRFEPVPAPELVPRIAFGPGEGVERLAIRSAPGQTAAQYAAASQQAPDEMLRFRGEAERHVAAAKASLQLVESHGRLDDAIEAVRGLDPDAAAAAAQTFYDLAARESGTFRDAPGAVFVTTGDHDGAAQGYVWVDTDDLTLPYLPDPLCAGALAHVLFEESGTEQTVRIPFENDGRWYTPRPIRLRLAEGGEAAAYDAADRVLTVAVPQGRVARVRLSSLLDDDPDLFAILEWCRQELSPDRVEQVYDAIKSSTHWMTTPWRDLVLVHATQKPVTPPALRLARVDNPAFPGVDVLARPAGGTAASLVGRLEFDPPSTAQLDLTAHWDELVPDFDSGVIARPTRADVFSLPVPDTLGTQWQAELAPFVVPVARGRVTFMTRANEVETPETRRLHLVAKAGGPGLTAPARRRLEAAAAQIEKLRDHELGDTKYRSVRYQPVATTRYREYFNPTMPASDGAWAGNEVRVEVLSSAQPAKPTVHQVLPIAKYGQSGAADGNLTSRREHVGLRVWLGSEWFSSGAGELLALVCGGGGPLSPEGELSREITAILQDPAHASVMPRPLQAQSFQGTRLVRRNVPLAGQSALLRDIAAYEPVWDRGRQAWYCDVAFPTGMAYFPFVRLGLARYQEHSLPGLELSPIVATSFVQTLPDRLLTTVREPDGTLSVTLTGPAPSASLDLAGSVAAVTNVVTATVERHLPGVADPYVGWEATGPEVELPAAPVAEWAATGEATWRGTLAAPALDGDLRVTIREFEEHPADDRSTDPSPGLVLVRRLVYADVIPL